jgi:hypothetical protein
MPGPVDWEAVKLQQKAMAYTVLKRTKEHPPKNSKPWKLLLIVGIILVVLVAFIVFTIIMDKNGRFV